MTTTDTLKDIINSADIELNKERFLSIIRENVKREGVDELINYLEKSDFFVAPASTKYHGNNAGGLCKHSLRVYDLLKKEQDKEKETDETIAIVSLLHDVCKINFYKLIEKAGKKVYCVEDDFPIGHGEKSVIIILKYLNLTKEEMLTIRWHMSTYDCAQGSSRSALRSSMNKYPLVVKLQQADQDASFIYHE